MRKTWTKGTKSFQLLSTPTSAKSPLPGPHHPFCSSASRRFYRNTDKSQLREPIQNDSLRPAFERTRALRSNYRGGSIDPKEREFLLQAPDPFANECRPRFEQTGLVCDRVSDYKGNLEADFRNLDHRIYEHINLLRSACKIAAAYNWHPLNEVEARKLCARTEDARYPKIYRSIERQAQALYVIGRIELEREPVWHRLAWYILTIAAGLGQLDAALLLHQLGKYHYNLMVEEEVRSVIAKAAKAQLDWRAMHAHVENLISKARGSSGRDRIPKSDLDQCLHLLRDAMALTGPTMPAAEFETARLPNGYFVVDQLEVFPPPYKLVLDLTASELRAGNDSGEVRQLHESAAETGALTYHDPAAAWQLATFRLTNRYGGEIPTDADDSSRDWIECVRMAARDGNADACVHLAIHLLRRDGWLPTLTTTKMDTYQTTSESRRTDQAERDLHDEIMQQNPHKKKQLDETGTDDSGLEWMKVAARLNLGNPTKMLNRYCVVAGLLRQNGLMDEGRDVLVEAREQMLKSCVVVGEGGGSSNANALKRPMQLLDEYLEFWDQRLVHQILEPESLDQLLLSFQKT